MIGEWTRPSRCESANCPEILIHPHGVVSLRSSVFPRTIVAFTHQEWADLIAAIKDGEYDIEEASNDRG